MGGHQGLIHPLQLFYARVSADVNPIGLTINDLDPRNRKLITHPSDRTLVAGNLLRAEHHGVANFQMQVWVGVAGQLR